MVVSNVNGSSADDAGGKWLQWWARKTQNGAHMAVCLVAGCSRKPLCGGHLWLWGDGMRSVNMGSCYIAPLCSYHNNCRSFTFPHTSFKTKEGTWVMRIAPHKCYRDYA